MGPPQHLGQGDSGSGRGPFGERAFRAALAGCVVLVALGVLMMVLGGASTRSVGMSFVVLGGVGLLTSGAGLLVERLLGRRPPPPPEVRRSNGHRR